MTEHLPECHLFLEPMLSAQDWCICDELRACEARVTALATPETVAQATYWYEQGQRDALADAVQRVEAYEYISTIGVTLSYLVPKATVIALIKGDQRTEDKITFIRGNDRLEQLRKNNS